MCHPRPQCTTRHVSLSPPKWGFLVYFRSRALVSHLTSNHETSTQIYGKELPDALRVTSDHFLFISFHFSHTYRLWFVYGLVMRASVHRSNANTCSIHLHLLLLHVRYSAFSWSLTHIELNVHYAGFGCAHFASLALNLQFSFQLNGIFQIVLQMRTHMYILFTSWVLCTQIVLFLLLVGHRFGLQMVNGMKLKGRKITGTPTVLHQWTKKRTVGCFGNVFLPLNFTRCGMMCMTTTQRCQCR